MLDLEHLWSEQEDGDDGTSELMFIANQIIEHKILLSKSKLVWEKNK